MSIRCAVRRMGLLALLLVTTVAISQAAPPPPRLVVVPSGEHTALDVESGDPATRHRLRERAVAPVPGPSGWSPAATAGFVTWTEGVGESWFAVTRDAGASWTLVRPHRTELRLRPREVRRGEAMPAPAAELALPPVGRVFAVQLRTISLPEWRDALAAAGAEIVGFLPHDAHLVRVDPGLVPALRALDVVERVEPWHPAYRIEPELLAWLDRPGEAPERVRVRVVAFEWGPAAKDRILRSLAGTGIEPAATWPSGHVLELWTDRDGLRRLAAHDDVSWIDRWSPPEEDMDLVREDAGVNWLETTDGRCGQGVRGEVMDGGVQADHQDFDGIMIHGNADVSSHGTSTYGIVFGNGARDGDGNAQGTGNMPCEGKQGIFADYNNFGDRFAHTQQLKEAPYFASFQSNSWGSSLTTLYNSISQEMDDIIWRLDIAITQSQSNNGNRSSRPQAWAKNIISVGAIRHQNTLSTSDDAWNFSASIGPAEDGRIKPDVNYWYDSIYTTTTGNGYTSGFGGTSAATPAVAGILGLMVQMWSDDVWGTSPQGGTVFERQPHASTIKALLVNNAQQYPFAGTTHDLTRTHQGWGRPSARLARERAARSFVVDETERLGVGQSVSYDVLVAAGGGELKVTMVYPDPPGTTSATLHRINDVDLEVTSPSGDVYHGNVGLDASPYSTRGGSPNVVDTVENVFVETPEAGTWTIRITASEVNQDAVLSTPAPDVTFALVVTGAKVGGTCGNGLKEFGEDCDGADLGGATCPDRGCDPGGLLACSSTCTFDTVLCTGCPVCGDGACELGEDCLSCGADCDFASSAACGNNLCETADGEDCLSCPADCNGVQGGKPASRYCCGDGAGDTPVDCTDARCGAGGNICTSSVSLAYCCGDDACENPETQASCALDCTPPSPGEASKQVAPLLVTAFDPTTEVLSLSYGSACSATGHVIEYGELTPENLAAYAWSGQQCAIGASGTYDWNVAGTPSLFFVIVGENATSTGSYGRDSAGVERPPDTTSLACPKVQNLIDRCD